MQEAGNWVCSQAYKRKQIISDNKCQQSFKENKSMDFLLLAKLKIPGQKNYFHFKVRKEKLSSAAVQQAFKWRKLNISFAMPRKRG